MTDIINSNDSLPHKRRIRYKGKYPRQFKEKYKELHPEKYSGIVEKVINKGSTPAGMHIPIMVNEILDFLQIHPGMIGLDATLGYGGHTLQMLKKLNHHGHIYACDVDPLESEKTKKRLYKEGFDENTLTVKLMNFSCIDELSQSAGLFDFVLADLGVSSMQIDNPDRGFSYKNDGPLDLRLNPQTGISAAERLQDITQPELEGMLIDNADEPFAYEISQVITEDIRQNQVIDTTKKLHNEIKKALAHLPYKDRELAIKKASARTFQALRIDVNHEYEALYDFLAKLPHVLKPKGRVAILTFHSGEDRLVKKAFKEFYHRGIYNQIAKDVLRPSKEECIRNSRAHSTKMRWAIKA
ncbi:16S rRNA (cytosine(1402)-N(4))-methyltransferase RsmH [Pectinatus sottacetonis]|uniref:16S rRNA (cytosine(1402)-N(4))-methyltransferase RsmH n=1 Tax=Pectinatus sottacetonis TaxID=1002795 RepID=UPI0018C62633|nr:16S rRNA (cytosine(1402)-N(4))-methyltransferase RsmH [Pectinatus sottacetonis]